MPHATGTIRWAALAALACALALCAAAPARAVSDVCEDECSPIEDRGLFNCRRKCTEQPRVTPEPAQQSLPTGFYYLNNKIQTRLKAPVLKSAQAPPGPAQPGQPLRISLEFQDMNPADPPLVTVFYTYSDPDGAWLASPALFDESANAFSTFLPVPADAEQIRWFVRAVSPDENTYTEIPCRVKSFPFEDTDCLVPLSGETTYADYEDFRADPALDIVRTRAGYDENFVYFEIKTAAAPRVLDLFRNQFKVYYLGLYDAAAHTRLEPLANTAFVYFTPWPEPDLFCLGVVRMGGQWQADPGAVSCAVRDGGIQLRVARKMLPVSPEQGLHVFAGASLNTFANTPPPARESIFQDVSAIIVDYTGAAMLKPAERIVPVREQTVDLE